MSGLQLSDNTEYSKEYFFMKCKGARVMAKYNNSIFKNENSP